MEKNRVSGIRISGNRVSGGQVAKNNTTQHDATEVGRGNEGSNKLAVAADQAPLIKRKMKIMHAVSY